MATASLTAIRGAITVTHDDATELLAATTELLQAIVRENALAPDQLISAVFTATADLTAVAPARAARELGWTELPMLCAQEMAVAGALPRCVRVLLHVQGVPSPRHCYLRGAVALREDRRVDTSA
ncbi:MAG: chorismate mutase [Gemmatimonadaceae bacterium]|nr:chorismate mutase [Gemmatimonadaceae bacterium]